MPFGLSFRNKGRNGKSNPDKERRETMVTSEEITARLKEAVAAL
jgi:hypothetical protein